MKSTAFYKKTTGNTGEALVIDHLERQGFSIKERNYQRMYGEIDIIAQKGDLLLCIEVKNRYNPLFDMSELIPRSKQKKIIAVAKYYLSTLKTSQLTCRFDVALVTKSATIEYIENAFTEE